VVNWWSSAGDTTMTAFATPLEPSPTYSEWIALMVDTIQIDDGKGDYIVINAADFDPEKMKKFNEDGEAEQPAPKKRGRPKKAE